MQPIKISKATHKKIIINSSSDGDINTSMISLPRAHASFFGDNVGSLIPPKSPFKNNSNKINIISMEVLKQADSSSTVVLPHPNITALPADPVIAENEISCAVPTVESFSSNLLPADYAPETKVTSVPIANSSLIVNTLSTYDNSTQLESSSVLTAELPTLYVNLVPQDDYAADEPEVPSVPIPESSDLKTNLLPLDKYIPQSDSCIPTTSKTPFLELSPLLAASHDETQLGPPNPSTSTALANLNITHTVEKDRTKRTRKTSTSKYKMYYIDFLSDEEALDFSGGSSDDWTCNESESSGSPEKKKKKKEKKKKAQKDDTSKNITRKKQKLINKRKERKQLKDDGKSYQTKKGDIVKEKSMGENPCKQDKCKRGCFNITEERRKSLFDFFWSISSQRRKDWLINCTRQVSISRKRTDSPNSRRNLTYEYFINNGEDRQKVCQKFLLETLNVTQKYLLYNLSHSKEYNMSQDDRRTRTFPDKYSPEAKAHAKSFIEKLPAVPSHYNRKRTSRVYLPQELKNVSNLYRLYVKECEDKNQDAVGDTIFRNIFNNEYNMICGSDVKST